ncbi:DUF6894 family protein [Microvirga terricola]|uniref:DUF6894 domain-containing protein n=1 Tax=Microvirga terricola TaxID=2719797 RepID=A0ABX0VA38_9HYPH|nr:hypothetical protein [Microvirga terricola]NIX76196.1 hypothetical protein [Microvirga terricola]
MAGKISRNNITPAEWEYLRSTMRCYFHLVNGNERIADQDGIEVRDIEQARSQAWKAIEELRAEDDASASEWKDWRLEVTDADGKIYFSITLGGALH